MTCILIRHREKTHSNGDVKFDYPFDPSLTKKGIEQCFILAKELIQNHGLPKKILCSPFLRTRQTAVYLQKYIHETHGTIVNIYVHSELSEYLRNWNNRKKHSEIIVTPETRKHGFPHLENSVVYSKRITKITDKLIETGTWMVSHRKIIKDVQSSVKTKICEKCVKEPLYDEKNEKNIMVVSDSVVKSMNGNCMCSIKYNYNCSYNFDVNNCNCKIECLCKFTLTSELIPKNCSNSNRLLNSMGFPMNPNKVKFDSKYKV